MKYETVIFDLDGTLLDTLDDLADATNRTMEHFGFPKRSREEIRSFVGNGIAKLVERAIPGGTDNPKYEEALAWQKEYYNDHCLEKTVPYPGIMDLLKKLYEQGYKLGIVSNKPQPSVERLTQIFFRDYISISVGDKKGVARKPAPDSVLEAVRQLGSTLEKSIYVGDSEVDIQTADNAGIACIAVSWGFRDYEQLRQAQAVHICKNSQQLLDMINGRI